MYYFTIRSLSRSWKIIGQIGLDLQVPALVKGGFRVIAPDLRGAINGESDAPQDVQAYNLTKVLVKDVAGTCIL